MYYHGKSQYPPTPQTSSFWQNVPSNSLHCFGGLGVGLGVGIGLVVGIGLHLQIPFLGK